MSRRMNFLLLSTFAIAAFFVQGCLDIGITTHVNTNGSILRTVVITGDSSDIYGDKIPLPLDSTWKKSIKKTDSRKFTLTATRLFEGTEEMNNSLKGTEGKTLGARVEFQRHFQWFFTTFRYSETWPNFNPFRAVPITDYISQAEIDYWVRHEMNKEPYSSKGDSLAMEDAGKRFEKWDDENLFADYFNAFLEGVRKLNDPSLTPKYVAGMKDELFKQSEKYFKMKNMDTVTIVFGRVLKSRNVKKAVALNMQAFERLGEKRAFLEEITTNTYLNSVVMPGLITGTNAPTLEGNKASWKDYVKFGYFEDVTMWVESRVINWWAIIVTGVVIVALVVLFLTAILRRRRFAAAPVS
jgi:hypothetical protein